MRIFVLLSLIALVGCSDNQEQPKVYNTITVPSDDSAIAVKNTMELENLKEEIQTDIDYLKDFYFVTEDFNSVDHFKNAANIFTDAANHIRKAERNFPDNKEVISLVKQLKTKLPAAQKKYFPKLRKSYALFIKKMLWEQDIDVVYGGTTLTFVGGYFAANANIKSTQETFSDILTLLRFKQVNYKWMKYADEFTYYDLESPPDSKID